MACQLNSTTDVGMSDSIHLKVRRSTTNSSVDHDRVRNELYYKLLAEILQTEMACARVYRICSRRSTINLSYFWQAHESSAETLSDILKEEGEFRKPQRFLVAPTITKVLATLTTTYSPRWFMDRTERHHYENLENILLNKYENIRNFTPPKDRLKIFALTKSTRYNIDRLDNTYLR